MGNSSSSNVADAFDPNKNGFNNAFDPNKNGVADAFNPDKNGFNSAINLVGDKLDPNKNGTSDFFNKTLPSEFDPNNDNGTMGKINNWGQNAFKKGGDGLNIMRKAGDIGNQIGDYYDIGGDGALMLGTGLDVMGMPEFGVPLQVLGGELKLAASIAHYGGRKLHEGADFIEKPKKDKKLEKDIPTLIFH